MKTKLRLKNKKLVTDLNDLKLFLKNIPTKEFKKESERVHKWIKDYKDDKLAQEILNCNSREAMLYCINEKLQEDVVRKLRFLDQIEKYDKKPTRKAPNTFTAKHIIPQSRDQLLEHIKEVHNYG